MYLWILSASENMLDYRRTRPLQRRLWLRVPRWCFALMQAYSPGVLTGVYFRHMVLQAQSCSDRKMSAYAC